MSPVSPQDRPDRLWLGKLQRGGQVAARGDVRETRGRKRPGPLTPRRVLQRPRRSKTTSSYAIRSPLVKPTSPGFTEALIEYALGRPYGFSDDRLATDIVAHSRSKHFALREFIVALVTSREFLRK